MSAPAAVPGARAGVGRALLLLAVYAAAVVWLTWPLAAHLATHLPDTHPACTFDTLYCGWALAHQTRALTTGASFAQANIFHPAPRSFFYGDIGLGVLPAYLPVFLATGNPTLALNVVFLAGVVLTAWVLHLVVRWWTASDLAGFVAAWTFLTTRWVLYEFLPTAPIYAALQYLPLLIFVGAEPARRMRDALRLLPLVVLQSLSSLVYLSAAAFVPLGLLGLGRFARRATRAAGLRLLAVLVLAVVALLPLGVNYVAIRAANPNLRRQTVWAFTVPTVLPRGLLDNNAPTAVPFAALALIALGAVAFALGGRRAAPPATRRAWAHGAFWALAGTYISITPVASAFGHAVRLPQAYLDTLLPIYDVGFMRTPHRLGVAGLMGLAVLAGLAFAECGRRLSRRPAVALAVLLGAAMYAELRHGVGPDTFRRPAPARYPLARAITGESPLVRLLREPGGPLLELPVEMEPLPCWPPTQARAMYRSIFHWRPLLNGYSGYWPAGFRERMELATRLPDAAALEALRRETGLTTLLVHAGDVGPERRATWLALAEHGTPTLRLVARDGDDLLFAVTAP